MWPGMNHANGPPHLSMGWSGPPNPSPAMDNNQWTSYYQTMPANQVDWAALARQWIANGPQPSQDQQQPSFSNEYPAPPPPPSISNNDPPAFSTQPRHFQPESEGGVANMDLEDDEEENSQDSNYAVSHHYDNNSHDRSKHESFHHQPRFQPRPGFNNQNFRPKKRPPFPTNQHHHHQQQNWNSYSPSHGPSSHMGSGGQFSSSNSQEFSDPNMSLDAAARKKLPAWIREGLEKMEKEKQKKEEAEIRAKLREEKLKKQRELEQSRSPQRSKFDDMNSDDGSDEDDGENSNSFTPDHKTPNTNKRSRFDDHLSPESKSTKEESSPSPERPTELSKEEILEEMTFVLRRTMTEILLEVTSSEISAVAMEVIASEKEKKSSKKSAGLSRVLANYGSDEDDSDSNGSESKADSDSDLEAKWRKKKRQFERIEEDIINRCDSMERDYEEREKRWKAGISNEVSNHPKDDKSNGTAAIVTQDKIEASSSKDGNCDRLSDTSSQRSSQKERRRSRSRERKVSESQSEPRSSRKERKRSRSRSRSRSRDRRRRRSSRSSSRDRKSRKRRSRSREKSKKDRKRSRSRSRDRRRKRSRSRSRDRRRRRSSRSSSRDRKSSKSSRKRHRRDSSSSSTSSSKSSKRK